MNDTLWILTEERPKQEVLRKIALIIAQDYDISVDFSQKISFSPVFEEYFQFTYEVKGIFFDKDFVSNIKLKIISGSSSFVDYLVYKQLEEPISQDEPIYAIEETKTDDSESRNTGVFQRITKFVYVDYYYPNCHKIMLYNLQVKQKEIATATNTFGNRLLLTLNVRLEGKAFDESLDRFSSIEELIEEREKVRKPPKGNVPIQIIKKDNAIQVSGRLVKSKSLSHDPNIGALSGITAVLRELGYQGSIELVLHGLTQEMLKPNNKFMRIVDRLSLTFDGLSVPTDIKWPKEYWKYEKSSEKIGSIFVHLMVESYTRGYSLFENHAGCEKGYFLCDDSTVIPIEKYKDRDLYKKGDTSQIIHIPDLVLLDPENEEIINIEAKQSKYVLDGIKELKNFDAFEEGYIKKYYPSYSIIRAVVLYGDTNDNLSESEVCFLLNSQGMISYRGNILLLDRSMRRMFTSLGKKNVVYQTPNLNIFS